MEQMSIYAGFIFFGLINVGGEPFVIEYNARMGDPETQAVLPRIKSDFLDLLIATAKGNLGGKSLEIETNVATTVVMVSGGYPGSYEKGKVISGLENVSQALVFHAGTKDHEDRILTNGGRVLAFTGRGTNIPEALKKSYDGIENVDWDGATFRKDIGKDLI
jgi:phosphoribosylamine--glycine ligase